MLTQVAAKVDASAPGIPTTVPQWLAVASLAFCTLVSVTTEFLPVGLLTDIADGLHVSEGAAGLIVTTPGLVAAFTGPALIVLAGSLDRRTLLLVLSALLVASNLLAALAPNLPAMLAARAMLGLVVGGFWTFAPGATGRLVPLALQPRALSYVLAGISVATVAGVPAGALLGNLAGWRATFATAAILSAAVCALQWRILPPMPAALAIGARDLQQPLFSSQARLVLVVALFVVIGHFSAYTFLAPVLHDVFGLSAAAVTALLLVYGVAGLAGTFIGGQFVLRSIHGSAFVASSLIGVVLLAAGWQGHGAWGAGIVVVVWGVGFGLVPVTLTTWMQQAASPAAEAGQAMLVTFFQIAIAAGAFTGGFVVDHHGSRYALFMGGALALAAAAVIGVSMHSRRTAARP